MTLKDYLNSKGLNWKEFKNLSKEDQKELRKKHEQGNNKESLEKAKLLKIHYKEIEENRKKDIYDEEIYRSMYLHLVEVFGECINRHNCSGTLKLTSRYLNKYCKSKEQYNRLITYVKENGGYCDCEVILNCPKEMDKK